LLGPQLVEAGSLARDNHQLVASRGALCKVIEQGLEPPPEARPGGKTLR